MINEHTKYLLGWVSSKETPREVFDRLTSILVLSVAAVSVFACGGGPQIKQTPNENEEEIQIFKQQLVFESAKAYENATAIPIVCSQKSEEACNAIDDNCDGQVDEDCGYGGGPLRIVAGWSTMVDIDLYVTAPTGETMSFQNAASGSVVMDHNGRGGCSPNIPNPMVENIRWLDEVESGTYVVELHYWGECQHFDGIANVVTSITLENKVVAAFEATLIPDQWLKIGEFEISSRQVDTEKE